MFRRSDFSNNGIYSLHHLKMFEFEPSEKETSLGVSLWVLCIASKSLENEKQEIYALNPFAILAEGLLGAAGTLVFLSLSGPFQIKP